MVRILRVRPKSLGLELARRTQRAYPADFWANHELGLELAVHNQRVEAVRYYTAALAIRPDNAGVYLNRGVSLLEMGEVDAAIADLQRSVALAPPYAVAHRLLAKALVKKGQPDAALAEYREAIRLNKLNKKEDAQLYYNFCAPLLEKGLVDEAIGACRQAIQINKNKANALKAKGRRDAFAVSREATWLNEDSANAYVCLGNALAAKGKRDDAIAAYREATRLNKDLALAYRYLGLNLEARGQREEAIAAYRELVRIENNAGAHNVLGNALAANGQVDEAIAEYRKTIRLKFDSWPAYVGLGRALEAKGRLDEAIAEYRKAIWIKNDYFETHYYLSAALKQKGQIDEANAELREALRLDAERHWNIGVGLAKKGRLDEAIAKFREAIRLNKDDAEAHFYLGVGLVDKRRRDEAIAAFREAIRLKPDFAEAHNDLGIILKDKGQLDEAIAAYREAIRIKQDYPEAHCNLGNALRQQGSFPEALEELRRGHELGSREPDWRYPSARWVRQCERQVELDGKLPGFLERKSVPASPAEQIELAELCSLKRLHHAAARFYEEAFAAETKLADDLDAGHRYYAACAAALAGCGVGKDTGNLDDRERARLRPQALAWLRGDLTAWGRFLDQEPDKDSAASKVTEGLQRWLVDPDFAGVRGSRALAKLPEAERQPWQKLWSDVTEMRIRDRALSTTKEDDPKDALAAARKAVDRYPLKPAAHFALGQALVNRDRAGALAAFRKAGELDPEYKLAHGWLGQTLLHSMNPTRTELDEAVTAYSKVMALEPTHNGAWFNRGLAYQKLGQWQKALDDYSGAIRLVPDHLYALMGRAQVHTATGQWAKARADYEKAVEAARKRPGGEQAGVSSALACLLSTCPEVSVRDPVRAVGLAKEAVKHAPMSGTTWITLGVAHYREGKWKEALAALTRGLELQRGNSAPAGFFLAMTQKKLGNKEEARKMYDQAVQWMEKNQARNEELIRFRKEAAELLGINDTKN